MRYSFKSILRGWTGGLSTTADTRSMPDWHSFAWTPLQMCEASNIVWPGPCSPIPAKNAWQHRPFPCACPWPSAVP